MDRRVNNIAQFPTSTLQYKPMAKLPMPEPESQDESTSDSALTPLRRRIDEVDRDIVRLLNERASVVVEIGQIKRDDKMPIYAPDRERRVFDQIRGYNQGPLPDACLEAIWREVMSGSFALERTLRIGFLGPPGSFSHLASRDRFGACVEYHDLDSIRAVFDHVVRGQTDLGLVPIENSSHGGISETLDAFLDSSVKVCAEVLEPIHHNMLANCSADQVKRVYSKPEALNQCQRWLGSKFHRAERVPTASTSKAAELASSERDSAAIGSILAAEIYGLKVLFSNVEDNPGNATRFFVIGQYDSPSTDDDKTAVMFTTAHRAGALADMLDVFRDCGLNLTHIDKRPSRDVNWEYYFFVDFEGHRADPNVSKALERAKRHCLRLNVLGSFPKATPS